MLIARQHGEPPSPYTALDIRYMSSNATQAFYFSSDPVSSSFPDNLWVGMQLHRSAFCSQEPPFWDSGEEPGARNGPGEAYEVRFETHILVAKPALST